MSDLVGNPEDRFSQNEAYLSLNMRTCFLPSAITKLQISSPFIVFLQQQAFCGVSKELITKCIYSNTAFLNTATLQELESGLKDVEN